MKDNHSNSRLMIAHTEASCGWGGQEIRILNESAGMIQRGHSVTILCPEHAPLYREAISRNIPAQALPIGRKNIQGVFAMRNWLKKHPDTVINTHSSTDSWLVALASIGLRPRPCAIRTRHISAAIKNKHFTRWLYMHGCQHIVTTGSQLRQQLIDDNGFPAEHITSVPTGVDPDIFFPGDKLAARNQLGLEPEGILIGIAATLRSWKGHLYLVDAFAKLKRNDIKLLIVGDGPLKEPIEELIKNLSLHDRVIMTGNQRDVAPWLQAMDIFVLPSYANEGVPQAIIQAMMCGLPVISTPIGSITEAVHDGNTGILVPPQDENALMHAMATLLEDPDLCERLGQNALAHARGNFGINSMLDKMENVMSKYCGRK